MGRRILKVKVMATLAVAFPLMIAVSGLASPVVADEDSASWVGEIRAPQYFALSVEDVDRSAAWYRKVLGLQLIDDTRTEDGRWRIANLANDALRRDHLGQAGQHPPRRDPEAALRSARRK